MADFQSTTELRDLGVRTIAASVDSAEQTKALASELGLHDIEMASGLDGDVVANLLDSYLETGDRTFLQPSGFVLNPDGEVIQSLYSSSSMGRLAASEVVQIVKTRTAG